MPSNRSDEHPDDADSFAESTAIAVVGVSLSFALESAAVGGQSLREALGLVVAAFGSTFGHTFPAFRSASDATQTPFDAALRYECRGRYLRAAQGAELATVAKMDFEAVGMCFGER